MFETQASDRPVTLAAALAALAVLVDAVLVGAPGLALLAVPLLVGLWMRRGPAGLIVIVLGGLLVTAIDVMYVTSNGVPSGWAIGDVVGVLIGGSAAAVAVVLGALRLRHRSTGAHLPLGA
jgi:hypothetical protein